FNVATFIHHTATTALHPLSLHDALPIWAVKHLGILGHSAEGAALCFRSFCHEGFRELGPDDHPDVTLDLIAMARSMPAWESGDRSEEHTSELQSRENLVCRLLLE